MRSEELSPRQRDVAKLVRCGLTDQEIADGLRISISTVRQHLKIAFLRTGARNRAELAVKTVIYIER